MHDPLHLGLDESEAPTLGDVVSEFDLDPGATQESSGVSRSNVSLGLSMSVPASLSLGIDDRDESTRVTENREEHFNRRSGRFHDPETGRFEPGSAPPDLDREANRFRAEDGQFKKGSQDLFDEREEVRKDSLEPRG